jgi:hypothetical protein
MVVSPSSQVLHSSSYSSLEFYIYPVVRKQVTIVTPNYLSVSASYNGDPSVDSPSEIIIRILFPLTLPLIASLVRLRASTIGVRPNMYSFINSIELEKLSEFPKRFLTSCILWT